MSIFNSENMDGLLALFGGFGVHLTLGTVYCFGNMNTYLTSYLNEYVNPDISYSVTIWILTLASVGQGAFMTLSGYLEEYVGVRMTVLIGCFIMTCGVYLSYFAIQYSFALLVITYGFMFGFGTALAYPAPMGVAMRWFPRKKGLVNGIILGGYGMGAFVFNQIQTFYLNPENKEVSSTTHMFRQRTIMERVPSVFLLLGSIYGVIQILSVFLISSPSESEVTSMMPLVTHAVEDEEDSDMEINASNSSSPIPSTPSAPITTLHNSDENLSPNQVIRSIEFWILWTTFLLNSQSIGYINSMYKAFGQTFIKDDHFLAIVGAFAAIFNSGGRIFWGHLCDIFGYRICIMVVSSLLSILYGTFYAISLTKSKALFASWVWAIFFCFCGNFVLMPTATAQCFGTKFLSKNYGLVMSGMALGALVLAAVTQVLQPFIGFLGMFLLMSAVCTLSCIINSFFPSKPSPQIVLSKIQKIPSHL
uniref:Oxalate:formate antiporterlike [Strongylocentrotus purpuratus] n=1 Tax=Lepeophtheirus salmonis TaxID=72036 RepID=A0A0K2SYD6_LEPSM